MADKKYIRDLNSLIRFNPRKRLKTPPLRNSILGGRGLAELGEPEPTDAGAQNMYFNHPSPVGAYEYLSDGSAPSLFGSIGGNSGLGIVGADVFSSDANQGLVYKNGSSFFSTVNSYARVAANSTKLVVENGDYTVSLYDHDGTFDRTFSLPFGWQTSGVPFAANDVGVAYIHDTTSGTEMIMSDYAGVQLSSTLFNDIGNSDMCAASKHCFLFVDRDYNSDEKRLKVFNTAGTLIGTHIIVESTLETALNGQLDAVGITENEIYLVGWNDSSAPNVLIYDLTLTIDGAGLATASALGTLQYTVTSPGVNGAASAVHGVINAELMA